MSLLARVSMRLGEVLRGALVRVRYWTRGIEAVNAELLRHPQVEWLLRRYGAHVGRDVVIHGPLIINGADGHYANLRVGDGAHVGRGCSVDLVAPVTIGRDATVSMGTTVLTHFDAGRSPLAEKLPRSVAPTSIGDGAYLGANVTVLSGCDVGAEAVVAAGAVVTGDVPPGGRYGGVPARSLERASKSM
jgi:acetyltransferase-like isoleucine patch superfamily enzyme